MKKHLILIVILFFGCASFAQISTDPGIDSLKAIVKKTTSKKDILDLNFKIAKKYYPKFDFKNAVFFAKKNISIASELKLKPELAETYKFLTLVYINDTKNDSAEYFNKKAFVLFKELNDKKGIGKTLLYFAIISQNKSDFVKQADYNFQSLKIASQIKDTTLLEVNNRSLAMISLDQKNYKQALKYCFESLKYARQLGKQDKIGHSLASIAETYSLMNDYKKAQVYFESAYQIFKKLDDKSGLAWVFTNWANIQHDAKAFKMRLEAQKYLDITGPDNIMSMNNLGHIGLLYSKMGNNPEEKNKNLDLAEQYIEKSLKISSQSENLDHRIEFLQILAEIQAKKGQFKKAYNTLSEYNKLEDSLYSQENKNQIAKLESAKELAVRDKQIQINKINLKAKEKQKWFFISGLAFLAIIGGLLYFQNRIRRKTNKKLQVLNTNLDQANKTKTQLLNILNHDLRSPVNSFIHYIQFQNESPDTLDQETKSRIEKATLSSAKNLLNSMEDILTWTKDQMANFEPQLKNVAVDTLFNDTKKHFLNEENIKIIFENPENLHLNTDENYLKTIIRNLTGNAIKALEKTQNPVIIWKAWQENGEHFLSLHDNGPGAGQEQFKTLYDEKGVVGIESGLGLHLIRDLAKAINCSIEVTTILNEGTTFKLIL